MEYKLQKSTNKFKIIFTGVKTNELEVMYNLGGGRTISPQLKDSDGDAFIDEVDRLVLNAEESGQLSRSANDYEQDPETELFVNIVIRAYKTMVDPEATFEVISL